jgi:hypothetical protein
MTSTDNLPDVSGYSRTAVGVSAIVGLVVAVVSYLLAQRAYVGFELLSRINPTGEGGGIGSGWSVGNTVPWLDFLVALVHAADIIMGTFIIVLMFIHWAAFRRLADRMRQPGEQTSEAVAADGGTASGDAASNRHASGDSTGGDGR